MSKHGKGSSIDGGTLVTLALPRANRAGAGETPDSTPFGEYVTIVPPIEHIAAVTRHGGSIGTHAVDGRALDAWRSDGTSMSASLCNCDLRAVPGSTRDGQKAETIERGDRGEAAIARVTCKFCQARLIAAGLLAADAPHVTPYAADYGSRALAARQAAEQQAADAAKREAAAAKREAAKAKRAAARAAK